MRHKKNLRKLLTLVYLLTLTICVFSLANPMSHILTAIKAAQAIESALNQDIISIAKTVLSLQNDILEMQEQKAEMIEMRDVLWHIASSAYTDYCGAMATGDYESAKYHWRRYSNAMQSIKYWNRQIDLVDREIFVYQEMYLKYELEKLEKKRDELDEILAEIDRLNEQLSGSSD